MTCPRLTEVYHSCRFQPLQSLHTSVVLEYLGPFNNSFVFIFVDLWHDDDGMTVFWICDQGNKSQNTIQPVLDTRREMVVQIRVYLNPDAR